MGALSATGLTGFRIATKQLDASKAAGWQLAALTDRTGA
jgi:hypothetical protein